jgi:hypothetical protein
MKITFGEMREMGLRGVLVYCHCGHHVALKADCWPDSMRLSDLEPRFVCQGCGSRGADVRPDFAPYEAPSVVRTGALFSLAHSAVHYPGLIDFRIPGGVT